MSDDARIAAIRALIANPRVKFVYRSAIQRALDVEPAPFVVPESAARPTGTAPAPATKAGAYDESQETSGKAGAADA